MPNTVKLKRGTATQWAANNPVLASGEVGVELSVSGSPQALKIGNGTSTWNALPYFIKAGGVPQPIAYGNAGAAGTSVEYARADHIHAVSGFATPDDVNQLELRKESRGTNLVTNGGLMMGNNYNFPQLTYSGLESPIGYNGSLYSDIGIYAVSTEKIAINLAKKIRISAWIKWTHNGLSIPPNVREYHYLGVNFYDIDGNYINCRDCGYREGSTTFLTADLVAGQSVMQVDSVVGWDDTVNANYRNIMIWGYANSYGYVYPEEVYTRKQKRFSSISGTTITLSSAHTGATIPAGTKVSQQHYGANGWVMLGAPFISQVNEEWEYTEAFLTKSGKLSSTTDRTGLMPLATAYVKLRLGLNYMKFTGRANANLDSTTYISGIRVDEMPDIGDFGNNSIPSSMLIDSFVKTDGTVPMTGSLSIESTQSGATTEVLYLKNNQTADNTAAALYFGFSTAANYYHAAMVASRTNLGGAHASKLEFMLRRAIAGVGKTFLESLFSLYYDNTTPYASLAASLGVQITGNPTEAIDVNGNLRLRNIPTTVGTFCIEVDDNGVFRKRTFAQTISDMNLLTTSHDALFDVHGRVITRRFSDLAGESDELGKLAWLIDEKRMAYGLGYGKPPLWQYLGITKVFPTVNDLMSESPTSEGIIACAITEQIAFVSYWNGYDYEWRPLVNEAELLRRTCLPWASLPSSPSMGHFQISYDKDVISFYYSTGGWRHLPVDSAQRIANPDDDYAIDPVLDKLILVDCGNNDVMITMPVIAESMGREFIIRHHKGENVVKIVGQPNNTVDGLSLITLTTEKDFVRLINDGNSDWCLVGGAYS